MALWRTSGILQLKPKELLEMCGAIVSSPYIKLHRAITQNLNFNFFGWASAFGGQLFWLDK